MHPTARKFHLKPTLLGTSWRLTLGAMALCAAAVASAQTFPSQPITMLIPYPPGGSADMLARPMLALSRRTSDNPS